MPARDERYNCEENVEKFVKASDDDDDDVGASVKRGRKKRRDVTENEPMVKDKEGEMGSVGGGGER